MADSSNPLDLLQPAQAAPDEKTAGNPAAEAKPETAGKPAAPEENSEKAGKKSSKAKPAKEDTQAEAKQAKDADEKAEPEAGKKKKSKPTEADLGIVLPEINFDASMDIDALRDLRQEALRQKRTLIEKKSVLSTEIRKEADGTADLKKERDALNAKVKEAKAERQKATDRIKAISKPLAELEKKLDTYKGLRPTKFIKEDLEKADWAYQTKTLSAAKSHTVWKSIEDLSESLKQAKARDKVLDEVRSLRSEMDTLKQEQSAYHMSVISYAKDSEKKHELLSDVYRRIDETRDKRNLVNKKLQVPLDKLNAIDQEIRNRHVELEEEHRQTRSRQDETNHRILNEKAKEVEARFKKTGKLTREDLLVLQEANIDL